MIKVNDLLNFFTPSPFRFGLNNILAGTFHTYFLNTHMLGISPYMGYYPIPVYGHNPLQLSYKFNIGSHIIPSSHTY